MSYTHLVKPGSRVDLSKIDPRQDGGLTKEQGLARLDELGREIGELQELLFASKGRPLLCVFQAMDTGGKDGAINRVISYVNIQSCRVARFTVPTEEERGHDFLWRIHRHTPERGGIVLFNRSHYEDVLVVRVHDLMPEKVWRRRYGLINDFEKLLTSEGTMVLKFYLHISKEEQEQRLLAREKDPTKAWKLSVGDWKERELWAKYQEAYQDALSECSTEHAPWHVVPADRKWFRDLAIAEVLAESLRPCRQEWMASLEDTGRKAKAELAEYRKPKP